MSCAFSFLSTADLCDGELTLRLARTQDADPDKGFLPAYYFQVIRTEDDTPIGRVNFRVGPVEALRIAGNIGYAIDEPYRGNHYAVKACRLLFPLARRHGLRQLCITCNPDNMASRRTAEGLGARLESIGPMPHPAGTRPVPAG